MKKSLTLEQVKAKLLSRKIEVKSGCWLYNGVRSNGYGQLYWNGKLWSTHRLSLFLFKPEEYKEWLQVNHKCDVEGCFNPDHLYAGDQSDNRNDSIKRGNWENQNKNKVVCLNGHEFTPENTYTVPSTGYRQCKICKNKGMIERRLNGAAS